MYINLNPKGKSSMLRKYKHSYDRKKRVSLTINYTKNRKIIRLETSRHVDALLMYDFKVFVFCLYFDSISRFNENIANNWSTYSIPTQKHTCIQLSPHVLLQFRISVFWQCNFCLLFVIWYFSNAYQFPYNWRNVYLKLP